LSGDPDRPISLPRRAAYALLTLVLFAALLEGALALLGLGGENRLMASRGFAHGARYVVPDDEHPGGWRVQITGSAQDAIVVPPRDGRVRVLLLGGSNTAGWPTNVFRGLLDAALPGPGFELINVGRAGYGSERMRILLEQCLEMRPDIVVIHEGHNEFVERGFAWELLGQWQSPAVLDALDAAMRLRALALPVELLRARRDAAGPIALPSLEGKPRDRIFEGLTFDQTQVFYRAYRENFAAMIAAARAAGARVQLSTVVSNPFVAPEVSTPTPGLSPLEQTELLALRNHALRLIPARFRHGLIATEGDPVIRLDARDWGHIIPHEELEARLARTGLAPAPPLRPCGDVLLAAPYWNPPAAWSPRTAELMGTISQVCARTLSESEAQDLRSAAWTYGEALKLSPDHPDTLFEAGLCHYLLGDDARAEQLLRAAMNADRAPTKGNDLVNGILRELAAERAGDAGFGFVDLDQLFRARSPHGLLGYEVMLDHCHLHLLARPILLADLVPSVVELARGVLAER
jgi:hypothetical protein